MVLPSSRPRVLVIEDEPVLRALSARYLQEAGLEVVACATGAQALEVDLTEISAVCLDLGLPDFQELELLSRLLFRDPALPVVIVTSNTQAEVAIRAMKLGAYDYVLKPIVESRLVPPVLAAVERRQLAWTVERLRRHGGAHEGPVLVGTSPAMRALMEEIDRVAPSDVSVCVRGESGTGKELVARQLHARSKRARGPFVAINCAAIPQSLLESELFGHERGAFTGAVGTARGRFEQAHGGTLLLDEVGEMSLPTQAALLRVLQERVVRKVGGAVDIPVDVRIISATHRDLEEEVRAGRFRHDLYYRLVVYPLYTPPLRERPTDIPALAHHALARFCAQLDLEPVQLAPDALEALARYDWPGNVRELENVMHRALLGCDRQLISARHLPPHLRADPPEVSMLGPRAEASSDECMCGACAHPSEHLKVVPLKERERAAIVEALAAARGNVGEAARLLGIGRTTLYRRLGELGIKAR